MTAGCDVLSAKTHSQARDINMYNLFTEHSKKQSYIQSTFMPSASSRDRSKTGPPHALSRRVYPEQSRIGQMSLCCEECAIGKLSVRVSRAKAYCWCVLPNE
ncbi:hypothetical protein TNCV_1230071 [Trichonephila clavipes]|nr:hypothetical protein TNCV_1230071 [Trichonephila clavipes]